MTEERRHEDIMLEIRSLRDWRHTTANDISAIRLDVGIVKDHLSRLNGSVADHEARLRVVEAVQRAEGGEKAYRRWLIGVALFAILNLTLNMYQLLSTGR